MRNKELTEKGEKIKQKIIDVASRILRNEGFKKATIRRIAKECNTNITGKRAFKKIHTRILQIGSSTSCTVPFNFKSFK